MPRTHHAQIFQAYLLVSPACPHFYRSKAHNDHGGELKRPIARPRRRVGHGHKQQNQNGIKHRSHACPLVIRSLGWLATRIWSITICLDACPIDRAVINTPSIQSSCVLALCTWLLFLQLIPIVLPSAEILLLGFRGFVRELCIYLAGSEIFRPCVAGRPAQPLLRRYWLRSHALIDF